MAVAFIPYGEPRSHRCDLGAIPMDAVEWHAGPAPAGRCLADLQASDHVVVTASWHALTARTGSLACPVSVLLSEPPAIKGRMYRAIRWRAAAFRYILTHNTGLLSVLPNARFLAHGGQMLNSVEQPRVEKQHRISLIASRKRSTTGHRLRHRIVRWATENCQDFHALGGGYHRLQDKADGHNPFYFSVVIENSREAGYFTEKLIDSLLCRSLPVYWGAPDIEHFFDRRGMVICSNAEQLRMAIAQLTVDDYQRMQPFLEHNREVALQFVDLFPRAVKRVQQLDSLPSA